MSNNNKREKRIGGYAGEGGCTPLSSIQLEAIDTANRAGHNIAGAAIKFGSEPVQNLHQGEIAKAALDTGLRGIEPNHAMPDLPGPNN